MHSSDNVIQRLPVVEYRLGIGRDTVYRLVRSGRLAPPKKLAGGRASGWLRSDVDKYLESLSSGEVATHQRSRMGASSLQRPSKSASK